MVDASCRLVCVKCASKALPSCPAYKVHQVKYDVQLAWMGDDDLLYQTFISFERSGVRRSNRIDFLSMRRVRRF